MPYKSDAQRRFFNANRETLESEGVDVAEWNSTSKGLKLPKRVPHKNKEAAAMSFISRLASDAATRPYIEKFAEDSVLFVSTVEKLAASVGLTPTEFAKRAYADPKDFMNLLEASVGYPVTGSVKQAGLLDKLRNAKTWIGDKATMIGSKVDDGLKKTIGADSVLTNTKNRRMATAGAGAAAVGGGIAGGAAMTGGSPKVPDAPKAPEAPKAPNSMSEIGKGALMGGAAGAAIGGGAYLMSRKKKEKQANVLADAVMAKPKLSAGLASSLMLGGAGAMTGGGIGQVAGAMGGMGADDSANQASDGMGMGALVGGGAGLGLGLGGMAGNAMGGSPKAQALAALLGGLGGGVAGGALGSYGKKKNKEKQAVDKLSFVKAAMVQAIQTKVASLQREIFVNHLDEVASFLPFNKQASVRVIQAAVSKGKPLSHAIKLAYPRLNGEQRGILASDMVRSAHTSLQKRATGMGMSMGADSGGEMGVPTQETQTYNGPMSGVGAAMQSMGV